MKIKWLENVDNNHLDSIWYGGDIVVIKYRHYIITIGAFGDIRAKIKGDYYCDKCNGGNFNEYLRENDITNDDELKLAIRNGDIEFYDNNWFEMIVWDDKKKDYVENYDTVVDLEPNDDFKWIKTWIKQNA